MSGRTPGRSYTKPSSVSSTPGGHEYHFAKMENTNNDFEEEDPEEYELRPRGKEKTRRSTSKERFDDIVFINKDIVEGDTLNSIALQYCCTVADLKRVNNFINEQDFFALRSIKIPVKRFRVLAETHFSPKGKVMKAVSLQSSTEHQESNPATDTSSSETAGGFLQEVDRDIEQIVRSTDTKKESLHEVISALSQELQFEPEQKPAKQKDPYYGADWGLGWWTAVVIMLIVGIVTPIFYFLYYEVLLKTNSSHFSP
ncbi:lysM and putative peptidoglycan-binding domain-containing protein 3 [Rhinophrynus dorsalis]